MTSTIIDRTGSSSSSAAVERETGLLSSASLKGPCRTLSLTAITLSGERTVASVALVTGDRVLVGAQADETLNGIYLVSTGAWSRAPDWNRSDDVVNGTLIRVTEGDNAGLWECVSATTYVAVGDDPVAFASLIGGLDGDAIHSATLVTSIDDTDEFGFWDSTLVDLVRITFANMKATLKTYFDTIYVGGALGGSDNRLLRADGAGGKTAQGSAITVDDSGNMSGVGTLAAGATTLSGALTTTSSSMFSPQNVAENTGNDAFSAYWIMRKKRGSATVQVGDLLGIVQYSGWDGSAYYSAAEIRAVVESASAGSVKARMDIYAGTNLFSFASGSAGTLTIPGQIAFPASQNASADANTLDDYEEGTWTPALTFGGGATGLTYSSRTGVYRKIGNLVFAALNIALSAKGSSTGFAIISGLPFTVQGVAPSVVFSNYSGMASLTTFVGVASVTTVVLQNTGAAACAQLTEANFTNTSYFNCGFCFVTT